MLDYFREWFEGDLKGPVWTKREYTKTDIRMVKTYVVRRNNQMLLLTNFVNPNTH